MPLIIGLSRSKAAGLLADARSLQVAYNCSEVTGAYANGNVRNNRHYPH